MRNFLIWMQKTTNTSNTGGTDYRPPFSYSMKKLQYFFAEDIDTKIFKYYKFKL